MSAPCGFEAAGPDPREDGAPGRPTRVRPALVRLALVDPHHLVSGVLAMALGQDPRLHVVGQVNDLEVAVATCSASQPDVVILGITGGSGPQLAVLSTLVSEQPACPVLVLSTLDDDVLVTEALEVGARGYLPAEASLREVADGVVAVARGDTVIGPRQVTAVVRSLSGRVPARSPWPQTLLAALTIREVEVLRRLAAGQSTTDIAADLGIAVPTTRTHIQNVLNKLGVPSRLAAAAFAVRHGVV